MPGYDDANANDAGTLRLLANHLELAHKNKQKLSGILQFHRITAYHSKRIPPVDSEMLHMFTSLCENGTCRSVALCTTMWDRVPVEAGEQREQELCARFWQPMIERGAKAYRHNNTRESAAKILQLLAYSAQRPATPPRSPSPRKQRRISFRAREPSQESEEHSIASGRLRHEMRVAAMEPQHDLKALLDSIAAELVRLKRAQEEQKCLLEERDAQIADLRQQLVRQATATAAH
ncbi:hypothetical protein AURDEDRAFT_100115 [Auricularia subglabra TFB-10046 SS5]|nr:hypothetical protein AURDEDRAFT_100115 [Auricularia subglabra TFB-10046 SS5]